MNRNYRKGRAYEYRVMRMLENDGYCAYRTAGSHGDFDVIAWAPSLRDKYIQVKAGKGATKSDISGLISLRRVMPLANQVELWEFLERGKPPKITVF